MRRNRTLLVLALLALLALVAAACSSGDDDDAGDGGSPTEDRELTDEEQAFADAFAADFSDADDGLGVSAEDGDCLATVLMAELGTEPFDDADVTPEDLGGDESPGQLLGDGAITEEQADAIYTGWEDCVDLNAAFAESFQKEYEADDATGECFRTGLAEGDLMRAYMIASFTSGEELDSTQPPLKDIVALIGTCTATDTGGSASVLVDSIAQSLTANGAITAEEAQCLAQSIVDTVGADQLLQGAADGDLASASPEVQQAVVAAITTAAGACNVPLSKLGG
jgi:hypothetical protein